MDRSVHPTQLVDVAPDDVRGDDSPARAGVSANASSERRNGGEPEELHHAVANAGNRPDRKATVRRQRVIAERRGARVHAHGVRVPVSIARLGIVASFDPPSRRGVDDQEDGSHQGQKHDCRREDGAGRVPGDEWGNEDGADALRCLVDTCVPSSGVSCMSRNCRPMCIAP